MTAASAGLWLYLRCGERLLATAADAVERALLVDETPPLLTATAGAPRPWLGLLPIAGEHYGAWDLGMMLGLPPTRRAFILARLGDGLAVALRTDACLHVGPFPHDRALAIPPAVMHARAAFPRAFPAAAVRALRSAGIPVGLELDLARLWSEDERAFTRQRQHEVAPGAGRSEHV